MSIVAEYYGLLLMVGVLVVMEGSALGVYYSARFPDFREMVRSRYVGVWGSMLGLATSVGASFLTIAPASASLLLYGQLRPEFTIATLAVGIAVFLAGAKLALRQITDLFANIRI